MSELLKKAAERKTLLRETILKLHEGSDLEAVRHQLATLLGSIPYEDVVEVEQSLITEGVPPTEIIKLCDIHSKAMRGLLTPQEQGEMPPGHPVDTFQRENRAITWELEGVKKLLEEFETLGGKNLEEWRHALLTRLNALMDLDKHYRRKENLLFPYLEKKGVTGPSTVMWGKHDETRKMMRGLNRLLVETQDLTREQLAKVVNKRIKPLIDVIGEMIYKEENILFPLCLDTLTEEEWYAIERQSFEIGFCLVEPAGEWVPEGVEAGDREGEAGRIRLSSGSMTQEELEAIFKTIPFDLTFVDADDTVRFFTQGTERIFDRNRAIIGRKVQFCHPPKSYSIVQKILDDFHAGREERAAFWITMQGRFIHIEYRALRNEAGEYLGTLEISQDLTEKRALEGERRLLTYESRPLD